MMKLSHIALATTWAVTLGAGVVLAHDLSNLSSLRNKLVASLKPSEEVPFVSSVARGTFKATIDEDNQVITYELSYEGLEAPPTQAHIHVGQRFASGGVSVFLCGNGTNVPPAAFPQPQACPASPATITGEIRPANIVGPAGQGIAPSVGGVNEFAELVAAIRSGDTYANVHSTKFLGGEARGQIVALIGGNKDD